MVISLNKMKIIFRLLELKYVSDNLAFIFYKTNCFKNHLKPLFLFLFSFELRNIPMPTNILVPVFYITFDLRDNALVVTAMALWKLDSANLIPYHGIQCMETRSISLDCLKTHWILIRSIDFFLFVVRQNQFSRPERRIVF